MLNMMANMLLYFTEAIMEAKSLQVCMYGIEVELCCHPSAW